MVVGSPGFVGGSPGRWELTKAMQRMGSRTSSVDEVVVGSPHHRQQARDAPPPTLRARMDCSSVIHSIERGRNESERKRDRSRPTAICV